jgi:ribose transport system substrate-binding protein/inositol transport system substrate-binding protein
MNKFLKVFVALVVGIAIFASGIQTVKADDEKLEFIFLISHMSNEFMKGLGESVEAVATERGYKMVLQTAERDPAVQLRQLETVVNQGQYDGILLEACSPEALQPGVDAAVEAGIPIITVHQTVADISGLGAHVAVDFVEAGAKKFQQLADDLNGSGKIGMMYGPLGHSAQLEITGGYHEVMPKYPDIEVVIEGSGDWVSEKGMEVAENWLSSGIELDAIICNNDGMALGVRNALVAAGLAGKIKLYGLDAEPEVLRAIKAGEMTGTIKLDGYTEAIAAVDTIVALVKGETLPEKIINIPTIVVTKDNVDDFL